MKKTCIIEIFVLLFITLGCCSGPINDHIQIERDALMDFYTATGGHTWKNNTGWGKGDPCMVYWYGVDCFDNNTVTLLSLSRNNLTGSIPRSIANLTNIYYADLSKNRLQGQLPDELFDLENLRILNLNHNIISGTIPQNIGALTALQKLDISGSNLTGEIPSSIGQCTSLHLLNLSGNKLTGTIPASFKNLWKLDELNLSNNYLNGTFDECLCEMNKLSTLILSHNFLKGSIPDCTQSMTALVEFNLAYNQLESTIPAVFSELKSLESLLLSGNSLIGSIPPEIGTMSALKQLDLSLNSLQGSIPSLSKLVRLEYLDLSIMGLTGDMTSLIGLPNIKFMDVSANSLTGTLPDEIPRLRFLTDFDASSNLLGGTVPDWVATVNCTMYLMNNPFICPYPINIPTNVQLNEDCVGSVWYQGLLFVTVCVLTLIGYIITSISVTLAISFGLKPALLTMLTKNGSELDVDKLHQVSRRLGKAKIAVYMFAAAENILSISLAMVGIAMYFKNKQLYTTILISSIEVTAVLLLIKSSSIIFFVRRNFQRVYLGLTVFQLLQLIFIPWAYQLEGVSFQSNELSACVISIIIVDTITDVFVALCAYLTQDQFIPTRHLKLDDKLNNAEGVFGEVRHGKYFGMDIAVKRAKPETKKERKLIFQAFLREAKILGELGNHHNIVKLIGISPMLKDEFYIVMEYCDQKDALSYLKKVHREEDTKTWIRCILKLCVGVCDAMKYVHSKGYTHRDITACNILVKGDRAMLADLGLARKQSEISDEFDCMPPNHSLYAPPEIRTSPDKYTNGCDVYCFGIALWEMLMLRRWTEQDVERGISVLEDLNEFPLFFKNVISQCWHEEDALRPSFNELFEDFTFQYNQEWSTYREVMEEPKLPPQVLQLLTNLPKRNPSKENVSYRVVSFSTSDIVQNDAYRPPSHPNSIASYASLTTPITSMYSINGPGAGDVSLTNFARP